MTIRDEEILNASTVYHEEQCHCDGWNYDCIEGAEWADQHPRKGLWDAEKVCKCLYEKVIDITYLNEDNTNEHYDKDEFIGDLCKAMED